MEYTENTMSIQGIKRRLKTGEYHVFRELFIKHGSRTLET